MDKSFLALEAKVGEAAQALAAMANTKRLLILCHLLEGDKSVGELAEIFDLAATALSQHLSKTTALRLVLTRRDEQKID